MNNSKRVVLTKEAAKILGVSTSTVLRLARRGEIKSWRLTGSYGFALEDLLAYRGKVS